MRDRTMLSKAMSHALRHDPRRYGLVLDDDGWTTLGALREGLARSGLDASLDDIRSVVRHGTKQRHEIDGDRIRARYGHSLPTPIELPVDSPPPLLFHGTTADAARVIATEGLRPMGRQYVHLSPARETAERVGSRRTPEPVVLTVDAHAAAEAGIRFRRGNDDTWLADPIPPRFVQEG